jgi:hypothetical protein
MEKKVKHNAAEARGMRKKRKKKEGKFPDEKFPLGKSSRAQ